MLYSVTHATLYIYMNVGTGSLFGRFDTRFGVPSQVRYGFGIMLRHRRCGPLNKKDTLPIM